MLRSRSLPGLFVIGSLLAACGGSEGSGSGSGGSGTGTSGTTGGSGGGAPVGERVIVHDPAGKPVPDVDVVVHDAAGAAVQTKKTDSSGTADIDLPQGGGVTVLWRINGAGNKPHHGAMSALGLGADSEVRVVIDAYVENPSGSMMLDFDGLPPLTGPDWDIEVSCRDDTMLGEKSFTYKGCPNSDSFDVMAFFYETGTRQVFPAQAKTPGQPQSFTLDLTLSEPVSPVHVTSALPPDITMFWASLTANRPEGGRNRVERHHDPQQNPMHNLPRMFASAGATFDLTLTADSPTQYYGRTIPSATAPDSFDWTLPTLALVQPFDSVGGTAARPEVTWQLAASGGAGDAMRLRLQSNKDNGSTALYWSVYVAQASSGTVTFPELPSEFAAEWLPEPGQFAAIFADHVDAASGDGVLGAVNAAHDRVDISYVAALGAVMLGN